MLPTREHRQHVQMFWRQWDGQRQRFLSENVHLLRKLVSEPKEQEQKSPVGGFLWCFSRGDADLMLPVVQWDSPVPRVGEFTVLSLCIMVCSAVATRAPHASRCRRCWVLLPVSQAGKHCQIQEEGSREGAELQGITLEADGIQGASCLAGSW